MTNEQQISIPEKAREMIIDKARVAAEAMQARDAAVQLLMAALDVPEGWQIAPDASAFVGPVGTGDGGEVEAAVTT